MAAPADDLPVLQVTALTHRGAVRERNEDALVVGAFTACAAEFANPVRLALPLAAPVVVAVADGMGGHAAGDLASALAVRGLATAAPRDADELSRVLAEVDTELIRLSARDPQVAGLGTTIAGVLVGADCSSWFTVGDSRVYREHGGYLARLSTDDRAPSGALTRCLGGRGDGAPVAVQCEPVGGPGRLLLCTDGLSDLVELERMEELLTASDCPARAVKSLWAAAMNASGRDNISIIALDVER